MRVERSLIRSRSGSDISEPEPLTQGQHPAAIVTLPSLPLIYGGKPVTFRDNRLFIGDVPQPIRRRL